MALLIDPGCNNCNDCHPVCPTRAISAGAVRYVIDAASCTECVGFFGKPRCIEACSVGCIVPDPGCREDIEQLLEKFFRLRARAKPDGCSLCAENRARS